MTNPIAPNLHPVTAAQPSNPAAPTNTERIRVEPPRVDSRLDALYRKFSLMLGAPTGPSVQEAGGNVKQVFEGGYILLSPDGALYARKLDNSPLGEIHPPPPSDGSA